MKAQTAKRHDIRRRALRHKVHKKIVARRKAFAMATMLEMDPLPAKV